MGAVIGVVGFLGLVVFLIWLIVAAIKKRAKKTPLIGLLICVVLLGVGTATTPDAGSSSYSSNPLMAAKEITQDVYNGSSTEVIGQQCRVVITKDQLKSLTEEQFSEFVTNRVEGQSYTWYTIACSDIGIQFYGCCPDTIVYGEIGNDAIDFYVVDPVFGNITKDSSGNYLIQEMQNSIS